MNLNLAKIIQKDGIVKIQNFLSDIELEEFRKIIKYYSAPKAQKTVIGQQTRN